MRLNRNTLLLLVGSLVVIVAVLALSGAPTSAPSDPPDSDSEANTGVFFEDADAETITRLEVQQFLQPDPEAENDETDETSEEPLPEFIILEKDADAGWEVADGSNIQELELDQGAINTELADFLALDYADAFEADDLAAFGLDAPEYIFTAAVGETTYTLQRGKLTPDNLRYYVLLGEDMSMVYVLGKSKADSLQDLASDPPYIQPPTPTPVPVLNVPGPLFPTITGPQIIRMELQETASEQYLIFEQAEPGVWSMDSSVHGLTEGVDAQLANNLVSVFLFMEATDSLTVDDVGTVGLDEPAFIFSIMLNNGEEHTVKIGDTDPTGSRYYAQVDEIAEVAVLSQNGVLQLAEMVASPPAPPEETPEATAEATAETD